MTCPLIFKSLAARASDIFTSWAVFFWYIPGFIFHFWITPYLVGTPSSKLLYSVPGTFIQTSIGAIFVFCKGVIFSLQWVLSSLPLGILIVLVVFALSKSAQEDTPNKRAYCPVRGPVKTFHVAHKSAPSLRLYSWVFLATAASKSLALSSSTSICRTTQIDGLPLPSPFAWSSAKHMQGKQNEIIAIIIFFIILSYEFYFNMKPFHNRMIKLLATL